MPNRNSPYNTIASATSFNSFSINSCPAAAQSSLYVNDSLFVQGTNGCFYIDKTSYAHNSNLQIGLDRGKAYISSVRLYDRVLTAAEMRHNMEVDWCRFYGTAAHSSETDLVEVRSEVPGIALEDEGGWLVRGTGAKMAVSPLGKVTGSIGGGCSEAAVIQDAVRIIGTGRYKLVDIDLTGEVAESDGMVCGGTMKVLVEDGTE